MLAAATLATLLASAVAVPVSTGDHRALFQRQAAAALQAFTGGGDTSSSGNHLYFYARQCSGIPKSEGGRGYTDCTRCGEVDAAPFMPKALFAPENALALAAYAAVTVKYYVNPNARGTPLKVGRCSDIGYTLTDANGYGEVDGVSWWGAATAGGAQATTLMAQTCGTKCKCNFRGSLSNNRLPACTDQPDDPAADTWCSLCGPSTACPGCDQGYKVTVSTFVKPTPHTTPPTAPQPNLPNDNHLWFRLVRRKGAFNSGDLHCGEVDAGPRMPASLFEPSSSAELARYKKFTIDGVAKAWGTLELGRCQEVGYVVPAGSGRASWTAGIDMRGLCRAQCNCDFGRPGMANNCVGNTIVDDPSKGFFCSLCATSGLFNSVATIDFFTKGANIVQTAIATPDLSTLVAAVKAASLVDTLSSAGPFTVFAPTNEAFAALPLGELVDLLKPENKARLSSVLTYHVVAGRVLAADLKDNQRIKTVEGGYLTVRISGGDVFINSAKVITANVLATNGVVHIIDGVLLPSLADDASVAAVAGKGGKGGVCSDDVSFRDTYGTCQTYADNKWCADGTVGPAWQTAWGTLGAAAQTACCACGGGSIAH